jgi:hypothetical protein
MSNFKFIDKNIASSLNFFSRVKLARCSIARLFGLENLEYDGDLSPKRYHWPVDRSSLNAQTHKSYSKQLKM